MKEEEKYCNRDQAIAFLAKVAEAERLSAEVQKADVHHTVKVARAQGFEISVQDLWDGIVELQKDAARYAANVPGWIIDRLRVAVHD
jgi:hypothetical protein